MLDFLQQLVSGLALGCVYGLIALGFVFLAAALHSARGAVSRVYSVVGVLVALTGAGISSWHVYIQHLPPDKVPSCGPGFDRHHRTCMKFVPTTTISHGSPNA